MLKVGVTGGIGAGKSIVCRVFKTLGIPVFDADYTAKKLMNEDEHLIVAIKQLFGNDIYTTEGIDRERLASLVFKQPDLLQSLNDIVHPATIAYGHKWMEQQSTPYSIKEAAIFFESGSYKDMDVMIGVSAPEEVRVKRALQRPGMTYDKVKSRIANQMDDSEKMDRCDHVIVNDDKTAIIPQVVAVHQQLVSRA